MRTSSIGPARDTTFRGQSKRSVTDKPDAFQNSSSLLQQESTSQSKKRKDSKAKRQPAKRTTKKQVILPNIHTDPNAALLQTHLQHVTSKLQVMSKQRRAIHGYQTSI